MLKIKVYEMGGQEETFAYEAWRNAFDINEPIYTELCHDFYSTYEFDEEVYTMLLKSVRSAASTIRSPILRVLQKMITYGLCQRTTGYDKIQKNELWLMSMFEARHQNRMAKKTSSLADEVLDGLSALIYCRPLDDTALNELIGSNRRLIDEEPTLGVPRFAMPRPSLSTMQDLYDRMGNMEIHQGVLERMSRRKSYHSDR
nr:hypothetical protein [Tanacetum cinerariifolium]